MKMQLIRFEFLIYKGRRFSETDKIHSRSAFVNDVI